MEIGRSFPDMYLMTIMYAYVPTQVIARTPRDESECCKLITVNKHKNNPPIIKLELCFSVFL